MRGPTNDADAPSNPMESESHDRNQTGLRITGTDQAGASIQADIAVGNGRRRQRQRQRMSGAMRGKAAKRTCFPTMATMNHRPLTPLHADPSNTAGNLAGETSPVTNRPNPLTDSNPIPCRQLVLLPGPPMNNDDESADYKPPSSQPVPTSLVRVPTHTDISVARPSYNPFQYTRLIRSGRPRPFIPKAASADSNYQAPASGCGGGAAPIPAAELGAALKEAELFSHDDGELYLDNNRDDDTPSRKERRAVLKTRLQHMRQSRSGRPRPFIPKAASADSNYQAPASGCGGGAAPIPTAELDAALKEAEAEAKTAETVTDPQDRIAQVTSAAPEASRRTSSMKQPTATTKVQTTQVKRDSDLSTSNVDSESVPKKRRSRPSCSSC
jgi:hypothetical protein